MSLFVDESIIQLSNYGNGNRARLKALMKRAEAGEKLTIANLGGSITAGSHAETKDLCWASLQAKWWRDSFPKSEFTHINAGIGATGSMIGMCRLDRDILSKKPDLVTVEYSVNDATRYPNINAAVSYESIVRRCVKAGIAVILLFFPNKTFTEASKEQKRIGEAYGLPMISVTDALQKCIGDNRNDWEDYGSDNVHPNTAGHRFIADLLIAYLEEVKADHAAEAENSLPEPVSNEIYAEATMLGSLEATPVSFGSFAGGDDNYWQFHQAWSCPEGSTEPIVFALSDCRNVTLMYQRTNTGSLANAKAVVAVGSETTEYELIGNDPKTWGDFAALCSVLRSDERKDVRVSVYPQGAFRLLRVMIAK